MVGGTAAAACRFQQLCATALFIAMVAMVVVDGSTNPLQRQHYQRSRRHRLPQHQVHAPKREVPYPASHPLGRHKLNLLHNQQQQQQQIIDALEYDGSSSNPADRNTNIIAGDGSRAQQQQRQYERQQFRTKQQLKSCGGPIAAIRQCLLFTSLPGLDSGLPSVTVQQ
jgi:hypothetical protein